MDDIAYQILMALNRIAEAVEAIAYGPRQPPEQSDEPPF